MNHLTNVKEVPDKMQSCLECGKICENRRGLAMHVIRKHGLQLDQYLLKWGWNGTPPECMCGCGEPVEFHYITKRFNDWVHGHHTFGVGGGVSTKRDDPWAVDFKKIFSKRLDDHHVFLTKEYMLKKHMQPGGKQHTETVTLPALLRYIKMYVKKFGWFYPEHDKTHVSVIVDKITQHIETGDSFSSTSVIGNDWLKSRFKSYWNVDDGPMKTFMEKDHKTLEKVLRYRLGLNTSVDYKYVVDGEEITMNEHFDVSLYQIRKGFVVRRNCVSWFKPLAAASIWKTLVGDKESPVVWDPSCGFGARLLGFYSVYPKGVYYGTEPAQETYRDNLALSDELMKVTSTFTSNIIQEGSENSSLSIPAGGVDAIFTSPPYFDREKYFKEETQCWLKWNTLESWKQNYLHLTFKNAHKFLKDDGLLAINVYESLSDVVIETAQNAGFVYNKTLWLTLKGDHFSKKNQTSPVFSEPILVFRKN